MPGKNLFSTIFRSEIGGRIFMVLAIIGVLAVAILLSGPKPIDPYDTSLQNSQTVTQTAASSLTMEFEEDPDYSVTIGLIVGVGAILAIVVFGTLLKLRQLS